MAVVHIGLVKVKEGVTAEEKESLIQDLLAFKDKIPGIQEITAGENFSPLAQGFDFAFVIRVNSKEDIDVYMKHPAHLESIKKSQQFVENIVIVDYEV